MSERKFYSVALTEATHVEWAFGLNLPENPEGEVPQYACPAERYLGHIEDALRLLAEATQRALEEIPERIKAQASWLEKSHLSAVEEMSTVAPEVRRLWAVRAARDLVGNLAEALADEAKPHPRVVLPTLARRRRPA